VRRRNGEGGPTAVMRFCWCLVLISLGTPASRSIHRLIAYAARNSCREKKSPAVLLHPWIRNNAAKKMQCSSPITRRKKELDRLPVSPYPIPQHMHGPVRYAAGLRSSPALTAFRPGAAVRSERNETLSTDGKPAQKISRSR
jgi:hypothetical protein